MRLGQKILVTAEERGLDLKQLAEKAGVGYHTLLSYTRKAQYRTPPLSAALKIVRVLNVPLTWLADDSVGWPPGAIELQSAGDKEFQNELTRRRLAWLEARIPVVEALGDTDRTPAVQWCKKHENLTELPIKIEQILLCEWIADRIEEEYDLWFSRFGNPFNLEADGIFEKLKFIDDWLNRPACSRAVLHRARRHVRSLGNRGKQRIRELLPDVYAAIYPRARMKRKRAKR